MMLLSWLGAGAATAAPALPKVVPQHDPVSLAAHLYAASLIDRGEISRADVSEVGWTGRWSDQLLDGLIGPDSECAAC